ncbi:MAG: ATPase [Peptostreptococcaceae bacterium]|nr:ATPase [Peptostreptococcaceae bacterium]
MSNKKTELSHKKVLTLIESMQQLLDDATNIPLSRKVAIDKEYALEILNDIKIALPNQFKQAEHVYDTKDTIIKEAHAEAEAILEKTREYAKEKISEHEITKIAQENAKKIEQDATLKSEQIREGAKNYAIEMLSKVNDNIEKLNSIISKNIKELEEYDL